MTGIQGTEQIILSDIFGTVASPQFLELLNTRP
jgi:hypothetical protein